MLGQLLLKYRQHQDQDRYRDWLINGREVWRQNAIADAGSDRKIISNLRFKKGVNFEIKDGLSAAHTFREIFLGRDYDIPILEEAKQIVDVGANIGLFSYYAILRSKGFVHAFEADPEVYQLLVRNLGAAGPLRCRTNHAAVSSRFPASGLLRFAGQWLVFTLSGSRCAGWTENRSAGDSFIGLSEIEWGKSSRRLED
jgi:hypothetical protein